MKPLRPLLLAAALCAPGLVPAAAGEQVPGTAQAEAFADLLQAAAPDAPTDARALWLNARHLRWMVPPATTRVRLLCSDKAGIHASPGTVASGFGQALVLEVAPLPSLQEPARFSHVTGNAWRISASDTPALPSLWRGQLVLVAEDASGKVLAATGTQLAGALDAHYGSSAAALDYGAIPSASGTLFRLWAPTARAVSVCLYDSSTGPCREQLPLQRDAASGAWSVAVRENLRGAFYRFQVEVFVPGVGVVRNHVTDPWSLSLCADSLRSAVIDLDDPSTQPDGWVADRRPDTVKAPTDLVVYELHVRDFSRDDSTVPENHRGKYLAFTDTQSQGMRHLAALASAGVTDIHLLPTYDLASIPERNAVTPVLPQAAPDSPAVQEALASYRERDAFNWGYDPFHYNAPEGSYSSDADNPVARVREFRAMVQALHRAGLRVGLDVVFNHTMAAGQNRLSVLDRAVPGYYQRLDASGAVESSTCCSNTATENTMMAKLMIDSAVSWARHYRVDSFRFDLMGHQPRAAMERLQAAVNAAVGRHIHLLGEGWNFGEVQNGARFVQASQLSLQHSGIGTFSDRMRDAARGGRAGDRGDALHAQGWLNGLHFAPNSGSPGSPESARQLADAADLLRIGLAGTLGNFALEGADGRTRELDQFAYGDQPAGYAAEPCEVVNYVENHDNQTLFDSNALRLPADTSRADRARVQVLGNGLVLLSQGVAYLHAGQEIMRSKALDRNSFNSGDAFNRIDWSLTTNHLGVGLPPASDNEDSWPQMRRVLARTDEIAPRPEDLRFCLSATLDLLRIRQSSALLRLRSAAEVRQRLRILNTGPSAVHSVLAAHLDGAGLPGAGFSELLYALNADTVARTIPLPGQAAKPWQLHPVLASPSAGDPRASEARFDAPAGTLTVPPRTVVVFVIQQE